MLTGEAKVIINYADPVLYTYEGIKLNDYRKGIVYLQGIQE